MLAFLRELFGLWRLVFGTARPIMDHPYAAHAREAQRLDAEWQDKVARHNEDYGRWQN